MWFLVEDEVVSEDVCRPTMFPSDLAQKLGTSLDAGSVWDKIGRSILTKMCLSSGMHAQTIARFASTQLQSKTGTASPRVWINPMIRNIARRTRTEEFDCARKNSQVGSAVFDALFKRDSRYIDTTVTLR